MKFILLFLFISVSVWSQEPEETQFPKPQVMTPQEESLPKVSPVTEEVQELKKEVSGTELYREKSSGTLLLGHELLTTWVPFKWTGSYTYIFNKTWSLEAEYAHRKFGVGAFGFDVSSVSESRYSLIARKYTGNSFHWIFGIYKNDFHAKLSDEAIADLSDTSTEDFRVQGVGAALGIGNRWQWKSGFTLGIDWFRLSIPLVSKKVDDEVVDHIVDGNDAKAVKNVIRKVENVPTFVLLGINAGYSF